MNKILRIGIYYDGNYFYYGSNYFKYQARMGRINLRGLHRLIRKFVADKENHDWRSVQVVEAKYYRGRSSLDFVKDLEAERGFDLVLMNANVTPHYFASDESSEGREKGILSSFSLDVFEAAVTDRIDVAVLITGDGEYVPLLHKLNATGTRSVITHFQYEAYVGENGHRFNGSYPSSALIDNGSYQLNLNWVTNAERYQDFMEELFVA